jgi:hypothetical protein
VVVFGRGEVNVCLGVLEEKNELIMSGRRGAKLRIASWRDCEGGRKVVCREGEGAVRM